MSTCFVTIRLTMTHFHFLLIDNLKYEYYRIIEIGFIQRNMTPPPKKKNELEPLYSFETSNISEFEWKIVI